MDDEQFAVHSLRETLRLLALTAGEQVAALPPYVHVPDELALTFNDAYLHVPLLHERGLVTGGTRDALDAIHRLMTLMTEAGEALYNVHALAHDERWSQLRDLATGALQSQGWPQQWPVLDWISYVPGGGPAEP